MRDMRLQVENFVLSAASSKSLKEAELTRFVQTSRVQELFFQTVFEDCAFQLATKGVAVIDLSVATHASKASAADWIAKLSKALAAVDSSWVMWVSFSYPGLLPLVKGEASRSFQAARFTEG